MSKYINYIIDTFLFIYKIYMVFQGLEICLIYLVPEYIHIHNIIKIEIPCIQRKIKIRDYWRKK